MSVEHVEIESLAYGGDGVGHLEDGRVVFVPGACPGDKLEVRLVETRDRFTRGTIEEILSASSSRVTPECDEAACLRCGGCPWAQVAYEEQLRWKRRAVVDAFVRIAKQDPSAMEQMIGECLPSKDQWHYRNKVEFEVGQDVAGRFTLGMHAAGGNFDPLSRCLLIDRKLAKAPKALTGSLRFLQNGQSLGIERVGVRASRRTGQVEVAIWTKTGPFPRARAAQIVGQALQVKDAGVVRVLVKSTTKARKVAGVESLAGHGTWAEQVCGREMRFTAPSFFQVNTSQAETLIDLVLEGLDLHREDLVLDLYSGAGTFTLPLAAVSDSVVAIESASSSIRDLQRNLDANHLDAEVIGGDVAHELVDFGEADALVVDPPRAGLSDKSLEVLLSMRARTIAYVSCNPTTLARDVSRMLKAGYELRRITPVDMFPQSYHVETVCIMSMTNA